MLVGLSLFLSGCSGPEGAVQVDVGEAPLAQAYRVDIYAWEPGLDLVDGVYVTDKNEVTLENVPAGKWALLVQAQNGDLTTIGHFQSLIEVQEDQTTMVKATSYKPGLPGDALPETETVLESFGPNGEALLTALYAPALDGLPEASVDLEILNGEGQAQEEEVLARSTLPTLGAGQCGTCFISEADVRQANSILSQDFRPQIGSIAPGATLDFFVVTTFRTVTCRRLLSDAQTQNCLIFAEEVGGIPVLTDARALEIAQGFDSDNPFQEADSGIYNETRERFGSEWRVEGGRDGDERVVLVFLSSDAIGGSGLFGFFNPADQRSKEESSSSNEGEILYLNADRAQKSLYEAFSTLSHEFSHLIMFNQKVAQDGSFPDGAQAENAVLDEGLAVLNEELSGFTYTGPEGGNFFLLSAVSQLLEEGLNRNYFQFGGRLSDYGAGYLLWRFIHDQEGLATVKEIVTSPGTGRANIETVIEEPFVGFFQRYSQAVALNDRSDLPTELQFTNLDLFGTYTSTDGEEFDLQGLQDIRGVTLPGSLKVTSALQPWGTIFYLATGGDGASLTFKATGAESLATDAVPLVKVQENNPE